jgi:hypothetical protein
MDCPADANILPLDLGKVIQDLGGIPLFERLVAPQALPAFAPL